MVSETNARPCPVRLSRRITESHPLNAAIMVSVPEGKVSDAVFEGGTMTVEKTMAFGWRVYGLGVMALAMVCLAWADFDPGQPVPKVFPDRTALAYAVAAFMLVAGVAIQWRRIAAWAAAVLTVYYARVLGVCDRDWPHRRRRCDPDARADPPRRDPADRHVRVVHRAGARADAAGRSLQPLDLGRERLEYRLDRRRLDRGGLVGAAEFNAESLTSELHVQVDVAVQSLGCQRRLKYCASRSRYR